MAQSSVPSESAAPGELQGEAGRKWSRSSRWALYLILGTLYLWPLLTSRHLPMQDGVVHTGIARTLADEGTVPNWSERFAVAPEVTPLFYAAAQRLVPIIGAEWATRLLLSIAALLTPLTFGWLARELAGGCPQPWAPLVGCFFFYTDPYLVGLSNYHFAWPWVLAGCALFVRFMRRSAGAYSTLALFSLCLVLVAWTHLLAGLSLLGAALVLGLSYGKRVGRILFLVPASLPSLLFLGSTLTGALDSTSRYVWLPFERALHYIALAPFTLLHGSSRPIFWGCVTLLVAALVASALHSKGARLSFLVPRRGTPALLVCGTIALGLSLPFNSDHAVFLNTRVVLLGWALSAAASCPTLLAPRSSRALIAGALLVSLAGIHSLHRHFDREAAPLDDIIELMEPNARVLPIVQAGDSEAIRPLYTGWMPIFAPYVHLASWYHIEKGGISPFMTFHASLPWIPLRLRDEFYARSFGIASPFYPGHLLSKLPELVRHFDYILYRGDDLRGRGRILQYARPVARLKQFELFEIE